MPVIGTNLLKINVEKKEMKGNVSINNNIKIKDIRKMDVSFGDSKQAGLRVLFEYVSTFKPEIATMDFEGEVLFLGKKDEIEAAVKNWNAKKPVAESIMVPVMNSALHKASVTALILSQDMGLPSPIKMPHVTASKKAK